MQQQQKQQKTLPAQMLQQPTMEQCGILPQSQPGADAHHLQAPGAEVVSPEAASSACSTIYSDAMNLLKVLVPCFPSSRIRLDDGDTQPRSTGTPATFSSLDEKDSTEAMSGPRQLFPCKSTASIHLDGDSQQPHCAKAVATYPSRARKETPAMVTSSRTPTTDTHAASEIVAAFKSAEKPGLALGLQVQSIVREAGGWSEWLASQVLTVLEAALRHEGAVKGALKVAYDKACDAATIFKDFARDHPLATGVFVTVIALGVLVLLAPYCLELLGFAAEGPLEGKFSPFLLGPLF